jgi:hypothetical protein
MSEGKALDFASFGKFKLFKIIHDTPQKNKDLCKVNNSTILVLKKQTCFIVAENAM